MILADVIIHTSRLALMAAFMTPFAVWIAWAVMTTCRERFGDYPRGTRWLIRAGRRPASAIRRAAVRVFYGDHDKQQKEQGA